MRALKPWPKTFTTWHRSLGEPLRLILERVAVAPTLEGAAGEVLDAQGDRLVVAAGQGAVEILAIQPAGKRTMTAGEFLRGYPLVRGQRLGG